MTDERFDPALASFLRAGSALGEVPEEARARLGIRLESAISSFGPTSSLPTPSPATLASKLSLVGIGLVLGGAVGAVLTYAMVSRPPAQVVMVERVAAPPSATQAPSVSIAFSSLPEAQPSAVATTNSAASAFVLERRLVDTARTAYSQGDHEAALSALSAHASRFPNGALSEEREALAVRVLIDLGKKDEAQARGRRFMARYPKSLMLPAVEAALKSIL